MKIGLFDKIVSHRVSSRTAATLALTLFAIGMGLPTDASAQQHRIKLTTIAPRDSSYHKALQRMGQEWRRASGGAVEVIIYPGGIQGGEAAMVDRMRINQVQAALLTGTGLTEIEEAVAGLQNMPMVFRSLEELDYVSEQLRPMLEKRMREHGFISLFWGDTGWVRFFTKDPVLTPDDVRRTKLFTWAGHTPTADLYREAGFHVVPLETGDILTSMTTGLIDAAPVIPLIALTSQLYAHAPHMLELDWAPLVGALVITQKSWEQIPFAIRMELVKSARKAGDDITAAGRRESDESVVTMKNRWGLQVQPVSSEVEAVWRVEVEKVYPTIRGALVPAEIFDEVQRLLTDYRSETLAGQP